MDALDVGHPYSYFHLLIGNVGIGKDQRSNYYALESGNGTVDLSSVSAVTNQTAFLVARFTFLNGADIVDLWVNPLPGQPLPATPDATKTDVDTGIPTDFDFGGSIRTVFDEIRFGNSWEAVSPVN